MKSHITSGGEKMSMGTLMYDEHPLYNLGHVDEPEFRETLDQDQYGLYKREGYKILPQYRKQYKEYRKERIRCIIQNFKRQTCKKTFIKDTILLIRLIRMR